MSLNISELALIYYNKKESNKYDSKKRTHKENVRVRLTNAKNLDLDLLKESFEEHIANQREEFERFIATKKA